MHPGDSLSENIEPDQTQAPSQATGGTRLPRPLVFGLIALVAIGIGGLLLVGPEALLEFARSAWNALQAAPAPIYFGFMTLALLFPIPASILYVTAGPIYGVTESLAWIAPMLLLNSLLVHAIGTTALRPALTAMIERRGLAVPSLEERSDQVLFMTLVRVTPGIPYFLQSWAIVLAGVDRLPFVLISVGVQIIYAAGFVALGQSAFEGRLGFAAMALAFLVAAGVAARVVHGRLKANQAEASSDPASASEIESP